MRRRQYLSGVAGVLGLASSAGAASGIPPNPPTVSVRPSVEIGVYLEDEAIGSGGRVGLCEFFKVARDAFEKAGIDASLEYGGAVDVPEDLSDEYEDDRPAGRVLDWWDDTCDREYEHANLLVCTREREEEWERAGLAYVGGDVGVSCDAERLRSTRQQRHALHEIGHNLGLRHDVGDKWERDSHNGWDERSIMYTEEGIIDAHEFSGEAVAELHARYG